MEPELHTTLTNIFWIMVRYILSWQHRLMRQFREIAVDAGSSSEVSGKVLQGVHDALGDAWPGSPATAARVINRLQQLNSSSVK